MYSVIIFCPVKINALTFHRISTYRHIKINGMEKYILQEYDKKGYAES